jgi:hypothetical protein
MTGGRSVLPPIVYQSRRSLRTNVLSVSKIFPKLAEPRTRQANGAPAIATGILAHPSRCASIRRPHDVNPVP